MKIIIAFLMLMSLLLADKEFESQYKLKAQILKSYECKKGKVATLCMNKKLIFPKTDILNKKIKEALDKY